MKIAIICPNYPPANAEGGISHYTQILSRELVDLGEEVFIITGNGYRGGKKDGEISVFNFSEKWNGKTAKKIGTLLKQMNVDVVNIQYSPVMYSTSFKLFWSYYSRKFRNTVSFHTLWGGSKINHLAALCLLWSAQGILATNSEIMYLLEKYFPIFLQRTCLVQIGSNILPSKSKNKKEELFEKYSLINGAPIIANFGMSYAGKGMSLLLEITRKIIYCHKRDIRLLLIGGGISDSQDHIDDRKNKIREFGLENKVICTGNIPAEEVSELFNLSSAVVMPFRSGASDRRGSLLAALSHNKAIVTTIPELNIPMFRNGHNMIWPEVTDAGSLARTVIKVLDSENLKKKLEIGASELSLHFSWSNIAKATQSYFRNLIDKEMGCKSNMYTTNGIG